MIILLTTMISFGQRNVVTYYDQNGERSNHDDADYFTVKNKINDTCWGMDYYHLNGPLKKREQYKDKENKIKQGEFSFYNVFGIIDSTGAFYNGQQNGKWVVFAAGGPIMEELYQNGIMTLLTDLTQKNTIVLSDSSMNSPVKPVFVESAFPGGQKAWQQYMFSKLRIPDEVIINNSNISGQVIVGFTVETDGSIHDIQLVKSRLYLLDDVALDIMKKCPHFIPASINGVKIKSYKQQQVKFAVQTIR